MTRSSPSLGQWGGKSILEAAKENLGEAQAAQNYSAGGLKNRITPPGALKYPGKFKDESCEGCAIQWDETYSGPLTPASRSSSKKAWSGSSWA
jgi:phage portal protein BeeE